MWKRKNGDCGMKFSFELETMAISLQFYFIYKTKIKY